jgi:hypothetical protein
MAVNDNILMLYVLFYIMGHERGHGDMLASVIEGYLTLWLYLKVVFNVDLDRHLSVVSLH